MIPSSHLVENTGRPKSLRTGRIRGLIKKLTKNTFRKKKTTEKSALGLDYDFIPPSCREFNPQGLNRKVSASQLDLNMQPLPASGSISLLDTEDTTTVDYDNFFSDENSLMEISLNTNNNIASTLSQKEQVRSGEVKPYLELKLESCGSCQSLPPQSENHEDGLNEYDWQCGSLNCLGGHQDRTEERDTTTSTDEILNPKSRCKDCEYSCSQDSSYFCNYSQRKPRNTAFQTATASDMNVTSSENNSSEEVGGKLSSQDSRPRAVRIHPKKIEYCENQGYNKANFPYTVSCVGHKTLPEFMGVLASKLLVGLDASKFSDLRSGMKSTTNTEEKSNKSTRLSNMTSAVHTVKIAAVSTVSNQDARSNQIECTDGPSLVHAHGFDPTLPSSLVLRSFIMDEHSMDTNEYSFQSTAFSTIDSTVRKVKHEAADVHRLSHNNDETTSSFSEISSTQSEPLLCPSHSLNINPGEENDQRQLNITAKKEAEVRFQYPPVSSVRNIPRIATSDIASLFFSEQDILQNEKEAYSHHL